MTPERTAPPIAGFLQAARFNLFAVPADMKLRTSRIKGNPPA
ncbi:hypothetical protein [Paragemmobacter ruber]|nr:hypothetical protein [Rhodobacter ruber]